jgi:SPP1 family predicted phage head-tail adaptor
MEAGDLNRRITIETPTVTRDTYGAEILTWSTLVTVWASKQHKTSREFYAVSKINSEVTDLFVIRFRTGLNTRMRINYDSKYYDILGADDPDGRRVSIQLLCKVVA